MVDTEPRIVELTEEESKNLENKENVEIDDDDVPELEDGGDGDAQAQEASGNRQSRQEKKSS